MRKAWKEQNNGLPANFLNNEFETMSSTVKISFQSNGMFPIVLVLSSTILVSLAQVAFKMGWDNSPVSFSLMKSIMLGLVMYVLGSLLFMLVLRKRDVTFVFPFMTLSYVWVMLLSAYLFGEAITLVKVLGVALIFTGVFMIYLGNTISGNGDRNSRERKKVIP